LSQPYYQDNTASTPPATTPPMPPPGSTPGGPRQPGAGQPITTDGNLGAGRATRSHPVGPTRPPPPTRAATTGFPPPRGTPNTVPTTAAIRTAIPPIDASSPKTPVNHGPNRPMRNTITRCSGTNTKT